MSLQPVDRSLALEGEYEVDLLAGERAVAVERDADVDVRLASERETAHENEREYRCDGSQLRAGKRQSGKEPEGRQPGVSA